MGEGPWFPLYPERFLASRKVRRMDTHHLGIYFALLMEEWMEGGPLPDDDAELEVAGRGSVESVREVLTDCFKLTESGWHNETLEEIRAEQLSKLESARRSGKKGAEARWGKPRPQTRRVRPCPPDSDPIATPCDTQAPPEVPVAPDPPPCKSPENTISAETPCVPTDLCPPYSDPMGCLRNPNGIRREEKRVEENTFASANEPKGSVENLLKTDSGPTEDPWGDFAGWYRTTGHKLLWQGSAPPEWANKEGEPWTIQRDLSILRALVKKGESLSTIRAVIERNREPNCMLRFNQAGNWQHWYMAKEELRKAEEMKGNQVGAILREMSKAP